MKFHFNDVNTMVSHWMLQDSETVNLISKTPEWQERQTVVASVTVNGVELPFEALESYLRSTYEWVVEKAEERYADLDKEVERRLELRLKIEAEPIIDKLHDFMRNLEDISSMIKPYWEKE